MVEQYERLLKLGTGITMGQEGYETAFHATTATDGDDLLATSIVDYVERTSAAKSMVSDLENRLGMLEIGAGQPTNMAMYMNDAPPPGFHSMPPNMYGIQQPPHSAAYFAPQAPTFVAPQQQTYQASPTTVNIP